VIVFVDFAIRFVVEIGHVERDSLLEGAPPGDDSYTGHGHPTIHIKKGWFT
jgi:hypothetical protein